MSTIKRLRMPRDHDWNEVVHVELGANDPLTRAFESPNTNQPIGARPYLARDCSHATTTAGVTIHWPKTPLKRYHNCTNCNTQ